MRNRRQPGWKTDALSVQGPHRPAPAARLFSLAGLDIVDLAGLQSAHLGDGAGNRRWPSGEGLTI
jgi:hypothetical protein